MKICSGGACATTTWSGQGNLQIEGDLQIDGASSSFQTAIEAVIGNVSGIDATTFEGSATTSFQGMVSCECKVGVCSGAGCTATATCTAGKYIVDANGNDATNSYPSCASDQWSVDHTSNITGNELATCLGASSCSVTEDDVGNEAAVAVICCGS